ncbi:hypothetical protein UNOSLW4_0230 [Pseudomonas phage UNO-SLW4]|uniref:Uncharacterized protein n=5 Tax=Unosvirus TaxID=3424968 RepID=A0A1B2AN43_9CAUD|nr:hypothetical protein HOS26_gp48 [Pseudomonas phage UNO-SLW1]ANY29061.1 hypothetical protein UNOSLW4_0230 [Pseudomonas phage UNO-SLW4]ANY29108.1 hypothetical protein UNOSLW3_0235 [Pseudomonas phage UNO-SLW3]ANY29155.1 hypothetical protein UNOSLW2_0235 [Pseudomonas phage UNO-SLW2]UBU95742.1 hypothetical protein [Pseudomonas phage PCS4]UPW35239.1 hypothetical protein [Pseudomonas phage PCS5]UZZ63908.1 hypothetical protein PSV6_48 [Pseudomonas phage PSV6]WCD55479.1 hypothetical protein DNJENN
MTKKATATVLAVMVSLLKHRATYRFLAVLLVALGVTNGEAIMAGIETIVCAFTGCLG